MNRFLPSFLQFPLLVLGRFPVMFDLYCTEITSASSYYGCRILYDQARYYRYQLQSSECSISIHDVTMPLKLIVSLCSLLFSFCSLVLYRKHFQCGLDTVHFRYCHHCYGRVLGRTLFCNYAHLYSDYKLFFIIYGKKFGNVDINVFIYKQIQRSGFNIVHKCIWLFPFSFILCL